MKVRPWAEFRSDLPTDAIEDEHDFIQHGGRPVAEAIAEILRRMGSEVDPPDDNGEQGWNLYVTFRRRSFWCQIQNCGRDHLRDDEYNLLCEPVAFIRNPFRRYHPVYLDLLRELAFELNRDARFSDVLWYEEPFVKLPGSKSPVSDDA